MSPLFRKLSGLALGTLGFYLVFRYLLPLIFPFLIGTALALAAFTDPALALAFLKALGQPEKYEKELTCLEATSNRIRQRQQEAKAHARNKAMGLRSKAKKER